jgi:hypothetical protein
MPIGTDFAFDVKVIEEDEFAGELVVIGCYPFWKEAEGWIAIAPAEVAKDLIVGSILLDDIDAVFDR